MNSGLGCVIFKIIVPKQEKEKSAMLIGQSNMPKKMTSFWTNQRRPSISLNCFSANQ